MSEFNFLTGRKELFDAAPEEAMVVLETHEGQIYYAVSHNRGARYWYDNGNPGRPIGLIALFEKTRVIASRVRIGGLRPTEPKRDPVPKSRLDRMQKAQEGLRKAATSKVEVAPKPEPKPAPVKVAPPKVTPKFKAVDDGKGLGNMVVADAVTGIPAAISVDDMPKHDCMSSATPAQGGFVSIFALGTKRGTGSGTFLTVHRNGNIGLSAKVPFVTGDAVDVQVDFARGLIRVGKVSAGGRALPKSRTLTNKALVDTFRIHEGKSIRIYLTEAAGWWQGQVELAGVAK